MASSSKVLIKLSKEKLSKFKKDMNNREEMSQNIMNFIINEYEEIFPEILIMLKKQFLSNIRKGAFSNLEDLYTDNVKRETEFQTLFDENFKKIEEKYDYNYNFLKKEWLNYINNKAEVNYLIKYRKHCFEDSEYASHNCTNKESKFILISKDNKTEYVICSNCQKTYKSSFILCKCFHCDEEYYSEILPKGASMELFEATWKEYHCPQLLNKKLSCIKCKSPFYLNMKTGMLTCTNKKCNFISKQKRILWMCNNCHKEFTSEVKVYNPLDIVILNKVIKQTLLLKHRAHPNKLACCKLNVFFTEFYHMKNCKGILYLGEINDKLIIVCEKCHAVNYYERFIWTCPKCQIRFRTKDKDKDFIDSSKSIKYEEIPKEIYDNKTIDYINTTDEKNEIKIDIKQKNENKENMNENKDKTSYKEKIEIKNDNKNTQNNDTIEVNSKNIKRYYFKKLNNNDIEKIKKNDEKANNNDTKTKSNDEKLNNIYENKVKNNNEKNEDENIIIADNNKKEIDNNDMIDINNKEIINNDKVKGDDLEKDFRKNNIKTIEDSPVKNRYNEKTKNFYQSIRFRRHDRLNTDKVKSLNITNIDEIKTKSKIDENNNNKKTNKYNSNTSNANNYKRKQNIEISRFNAPEKKNDNEIKTNDSKNENNINNNNELTKKEKSENTKELKGKRGLMMRLNTNNESHFITKRKSVYMLYRQLRLQNENNNKKNDNKMNGKTNDDIEDKEENKKKFEKSVQEPEKEKDNKNKHIKNEKEKELEKDIKKNIFDINKTNDRENKTKGVFSKFLFMGSSKNTSEDGKPNNSRNNFIVRHNFRRSSMQNPFMNSKIKERISGKKKTPSRSSSSSSSSSFSDRMNKINEETQSNEKNKDQLEIESDNDNEKDDINKENSKKSTKVNSKEKEENKIENNNIEEDKDNQEEGEETNGIEVDNKNNPANEDNDNDNEKEKANNESNKSNIKKIQGMSAHLFSHITKRINHILSTSKIKQFNLDDYTIFRRLGEGSYGVIHCIIHEKTKEKFALKKIIAYSLNKIQEFTKEFELVHLCDHPNILKIYGLNINLLDQTTYSLQVLMEKAERDWDKDIKRRLQERRYYTEEELVSILRQLTSALLFMKEKLNITHRDIKPQNVLIFEGGIYKLADFGEAKEIKVKKNLNTLRGTELYMSPALYNGLKINKDDVDHDPFKSDLFSLGFCLVYAATMNFNFLYELRNINNDDIIRKKIREHLKDNYSDKFIDIITKMVELDEKNRFDFKDLNKEIEDNYGK